MSECFALEVPQPYRMHKKRQTNITHQIIVHVEPDINCPNMHQAMKAQGQLAVQCYSLLTSADGNEWSALCQGHFTLKTITPGTEWTQR